MPPKRMTQEAVLESIRAYVARTGTLPTRHDFDRGGNGLVSRAVVERYFRQWQWAVQAATFLDLAPADAGAGERPHDPPGCPGMGDPCPRCGSFWRAWPGHGCAHCGASATKEDPCSP